METVRRTALAKSSGEEGMRAYVKKEKTTQYYSDEEISDWTSRQTGFDN